MRVNFLSNTVPWFGKYSGYDCIDQYLPPSIVSNTFNCNTGNFLQKLRGKYYHYKYSVRNVNSTSLGAGVQFLQASKSDIVSHILYVDANIHLPSLADKKQLAHLTGTIHLPFGQWKESNLAQLKPLKHALLLYDSEVNKFSPHLPQAKLHVIKHGVDNEFFRPGDKQRDQTKLLCVGHFLRNFDMLERVAERLFSKSKALSLHVVIPSSFRSHPALVKLSQKDQVFFYEKLSDEDLLLLYQDCGAMLMPMNDSGANTAVVQAIACGTPLITTNTGGITSYGGNDIYELVENDDDEAMVDLSMKYIDDPSYTQACSLKLREFSMRELDWGVIVKQHYEYYQQVLGHLAGGK